MNPIHVQSAAVVVAAISTVFAAITYQRNARTKTAEFLMELHQAFFVDQTYKAIRSVLDDDSESATEKLARLVEDELDEFTDFLNFFELVAYMNRRSKLFRVRTLSEGDVEALLGYYLNLLRKKPAVWEYIRRTSTGFENLRWLLSERKTQ